jgi:predicted outer membrane repeat protein
VYHGSPQDGGGVGGAFEVENNASGGNMTVTNCTFTGNVSQNGGGGAIYSVMGEGDTTTISGSTFTGNSALDDASDGGAQGGAIHADGDMTVSNSRITGNTDGDGSSFGTGLYASNSAGFTVTATDNRWGCNGGPGASGCDTADDEAGTLTTNPWLVLSISASSTQIDENGTSNLTANLTENSNNVGGFSVPNGTPVTFGGTLGTDNPTSTTLTSGEATSVYTAGNTAGDGSGTATVDNATVSVTIDIGAPPAITSSNNATFTLGAAGTFNVTTSGSPTPSIIQSGALPSGVSFHDNGNGTGTLSGTPTQAGTFNTITFTASNGFLPNATQTFTLTVSQASTSIAVTNVNPASEAYGQDVQVTITAVLSWTGSGPAPTASDVTIGGNGPSGYSATNCGAPSGDTLTCTATYTPTAADAVGSYPETASFSGDSNYSGSSSPQTNNFSITQASSSTSVGSSQNPSVVGESVTFTATIDGEYGLIVRRNGAVISRGVSKRGVAGFSQKQSLHPVPPGLTGTVTWSANTGCSPSAVSGDPGTSQCVTTTLPQGTDTITATYSGDTNHSGSTGTLSGGQQVNAQPAEISVTPSSINFGTVHLLDLQDQNVTVKNIGTSPVTFTSISLTLGSGTNRRDFTWVNLCPKTLAVGRSCTVNLVFFAGNVGSLSATLNINDNAAGSPQQVGLSATVINPRASFNPGSLNFGTVQVGHSSTKNVTLTNTGTTTLDITSVNVTGADTGDFTRSNACPSSLAAGTDCIISVTFTPTTTGARSADLTVVDNAAISTQNVPLSGRGSN